MNNYDLPPDDEFDTGAVDATNRDAEAVVLAAAFASSLARKKLRGVVTPTDFAWPHHADLWNAMHALDTEGEKVVIPTLIERVKGSRLALEFLPTLAQPYSLDEGLSSAKVVHDLGVKRQAAMLVFRAKMRIASPDATPAGFLTDLINEATALRDQQAAATDIRALTLRELLEREDEPYDWLIPDVLERGDRLMLTGMEGSGKSVFLRQMAVCLAAGLHPFGDGRIKPGNALIIDAENSERQVRRGMRGLTTAAVQRGTRDPRDHVMIECTGRIDITNDLTLASIHQAIDAQLPDIVIIGPLYRITKGALQNDDDAAPVLAALDTIKDRGISLLIEAHAGHGQKSMGTRDLRPRGSSSLLGWPEFGYGIRPDPNASNADRPTFLMERWRGDRDARRWPEAIERGGVLPWTPTEQQRVAWAYEPRAS